MQSNLITNKFKIMVRLTIHLIDAPTVEVDGKKKSFGTLAFSLKARKNQERQISDLLSNYGKNVLKSYTSNIK